MQQFDIGDRVTLEDGDARPRLAGTVIETVQPFYRDQPQGLLVWIDGGARRVTDATEARPL